MNRHISIVASLFVIFCTSWAIAQIPFGNPKRGEKIYQQFCLRCHGEKLDGRGPEAQDLKVMPADLRSASARTKSDWELLVIVSHGVMFTPMHGFRDVLTEQDIKDILSYIRTEAPFTPVAWQLRPPTPLPMAFISTEHRKPLGNIAPVPSIVRESRRVKPRELYEKFKTIEHRRKFC